MIGFSISKFTYEFKNKMDCHWNFFRQINHVNPCIDPLLQKLPHTSNNIIDRRCFCRIFVFVFAEWIWSRYNKCDWMQCLWFDPILSRNIQCHHYNSLSDMEFRYLLCVLFVFLLFEIGRCAYRTTHISRYTICHDSNVKFSICNAIIMEDILLLSRFRAKARASVLCRTVSS